MVLMLELLFGNLVGGKGGTVKNVAIQHEYVIAFAKNKNLVKIKPEEKQKEGGTDEDEKGLYRREQLRQWGQGDKREDRPSNVLSNIYTEGERRSGQSKIMEPREMACRQEKNEGINRAKRCGFHL